MPDEIAEDLRALSSDPTNPRFSSAQARARQAPVPYLTAFEAMFLDDATPAGALSLLTATKDGAPPFTARVARALGRRHPKSTALQHLCMEISAHLFRDGAGTTDMLSTAFPFCTTDERRIERASVATGAESLLQLSVSVPFVAEDVEATLQNLRALEYEVEGQDPRWSADSPFDRMELVRDGDRTHVTWHVLDPEIGDVVAEVIGAHHPLLRHLD